MSSELAGTANSVPQFDSALAVKAALKHLICSVKLSAASLSTAPLHFLLHYPGPTSRPGFWRFCRFSDETKVSRTMLNVRFSSQPWRKSPTLIDSELCLQKHPLNMSFCCPLVIAAVPQASSLPRWLPSCCTVRAPSLSPPCFLLFPKALKQQTASDQVPHSLYCQIRQGPSLAPHL